MLLVIFFLLFCFVIENSRNLLNFLSLQQQKLILFLRCYFQIECKTNGNSMTIALHKRQMCMREFQANEMKLEMKVH